MSVKLLETEGGMLKIWLYNEVLSTITWAHYNGLYGLGLGLGCATRCASTHRRPLRAAAAFARRHRFRAGRFRCTHRRLGGQVQCERHHGGVVPGRSAGELLLYALRGDFLFFLLGFKPACLIGHGSTEVRKLYIDTLLEDVWRPALHALEDAGDVQFELIGWDCNPFDHISSDSKYSFKDALVVLNTRHKFADHARETFTQPSRSAGGTLMLRFAKDLDYPTCYSDDVEAFTEAIPRGFSNTLFSTVTLHGHSDVTSSS
jgi:hypothetical protein